MITRRSVYSRGMTLVELMIALTIGLVLLAGAASMFVTNKRIYQDIGDLGSLQENGRFALELILDDLRMMGHPGCSDNPGNVSNRLNNASVTAHMLNFQYPIEGSEAGGNWQPSNNSTDVVDTNGTAGIGNMVTGTDAITIRYLDPIIINNAHTTLRAAMNTATETIPISNSSMLAVNDLVAVTDCDGADIFQITAVADPDATPNSNDQTLSHAAAAAGTLPAAPNNTSDALSRTYPANARLARYVVRRYFIGNDKNGPALFWETPRTAGSPQVLVEGVENMQILYGKDTDGDGVANSYANASAVGNAAEWDKVVTVQIALLIRTPKINGNLPNDTATYNLLGTVFNPADDKRRRRIYTSSVHIRNRTN